MDLAWSLTGARGGGAREREPVLLRGRELCEQAGDNARLMEVLLALALFRTMRRDLQTAQELAKQVLALAEREHAEAMVGAPISNLALLCTWPAGSRKHASILSVRRVSSAPALLPASCQAFCACLANRRPRSPRAVRRWPTREGTPIPFGLAALCSTKPYSILCCG